MAKAKVQTKQRNEGVSPEKITWLLVVGGLILLLGVACSNGSDSASTSESSKSPQTQVDPRTSYVSEWQRSFQGQTPVTVPYAELFRNAEQYRGKFIKFKGKVIQVLGSAGEWNLRVNVTDKSAYGVSLWDDTVFVTSYTSQRVIEDDIIEFVGRGEGVQTYESAFGASVTIPSVSTLDTPVVGRSE